MNSFDVALSKNLMQFSDFLEAVGASSTDRSEMVILYPVARLSSNEPSPVEVMQAAGPFTSQGFQVVLRGGEHQARLFAIPKKGVRPDVAFGAYLWAPVHSILSTLWLLNAWRLQELGESAVDLAKKHFVVPAATCARALLETASSISYDARKWIELWQSCKEFAPTMGQPVPSSHYRELHNYAFEMFVGGKFKGEIPSDLSPLLAEGPIPRTNIQTCIDHLARENPDVTATYDVLCNAVHPSVVGFNVFMKSISDHAPGERRIEMSSMPQETSPVTGQQSSLLSAIKDAVSIGFDTATKKLSESLSAIDDIFLTSQLSEYPSYESWRQISAPARNDPCPCRSGRKFKKCNHHWGSKDPDELQSAVAEARKRDLEES